MVAGKPLSSTLEIPGPEEAISGSDEEVSRPRRGWVTRLLFYLLTLFFIATLNFFLPRAMPGDPISAMTASATSASAGRSTSLVDDTETRKALAEYYGLDRPLLSQYGRYLGSLARGDLGVSIRYSAPVRDLVLQRLPWSVLLAGTAVVLAAVLGVVPAVHSGWRRGRALDRGLISLFTGVRNFPPFFLASIALFVFAVKLRWLPIGGGTTAFSDYGLLRRIADIAHHLVLPASVLAVQIGAYNFMVMRAGMVGELGSDHLVLGRAKGLRERRLKYRYAARNAMLPVLTVAATQLVFAITVAPLFVESIFAYPGIGRLEFEAIPLRDYPLMQGCFLVLGLVVVTTNFLADLLYGRLDPRTRT